MTCFNYLGTFSTLAALWTAYPEGGIEGDYAIVSGNCYGWDVWSRKWRVTAMPDDVPDETESSAEDVEDVPGETGTDTDTPDPVDQSVNYRGSFASLAEIWNNMPEGGQVGDYLTISGTQYRWDSAKRQWVLSSAAATATIPTTTVDPENRTNVNYLGSFASVDDIWYFYPEGGFTGDYALVDGDSYTWDATELNWVVTEDVVPLNPSYLSPGDTTGSRYVINYLGSFSTQAAVWAMYPEGGYEGDYIHLGSEILLWNKYGREWGGDANPGSPAVHGETYDGSLTIMHDLIVAGHIYGTAADAELWNNHAWADYMNQALRTTDNVVFKGVTANSLKVTDGTSAQFLKADGSLDSNAYLTEEAAATMLLNYATGLSLNANGDLVLKHGSTVLARIKNADLSAAFTSQTASKLATARKLWGNSFDGSADVNGTITLPLASKILFNGGAADGSFGLPGIEYDAANHSFKISGSLYATGSISAGGIGTAGGGGGDSVIWTPVLTTGTLIAKIKIGTADAVNVYAPEGGQGGSTVAWVNGLTEQSTGLSVNGTSKELALASHTHGNYALSSHTHAWSQITDKPTTLQGYGITDAAAGSDLTAATGRIGTLEGYFTDGSAKDALLLNGKADTAFAAANHQHTTGNITDLETWLSGKGFLTSVELTGNVTGTISENGTIATTIANGAVIADMIKANAVTTVKIKNGNVTNDKLANKSITIAGSEVVLGGSLDANALVSACNMLTTNNFSETLDSYYAAAGHTHTWSSIQSKPTTLGGYGITDAATGSDLTAATDRIDTLEGYFNNGSANSAKKIGPWDGFYYTPDDLVRIAGIQTITGRKTFGSEIDMAYNMGINGIMEDGKTKHLLLGHNKWSINLGSDDARSNDIGVNIRGAHFYLYGNPTPAENESPDMAIENGGVYFNSSLAPYSTRAAVATLGTEGAAWANAYIKQVTICGSNSDGNYIGLDNVNRRLVVKDLSSGTSKKVLMEGDNLDYSVKGMRGNTIWDKASLDNAYWRAGNGSYYSSGMRVYGLVWNTAINESDTTTGLSWDNSNSLLSLTGYEDADVLTCHQIIINDSINTSNPEAKGNLAHRCGRAGATGAPEWGRWSVFWDSHNSNLTTIDWTCKDLHATRWYPVAGDTDHYIEYDSSNAAFKVAGNFYATGNVSAGTVGTSSSAGSVDIAALEYNVVPKTANTLAVGLASRPWANGYFRNLHATDLELTNIYFKSSLEEMASITVSSNGMDLRLDSGMNDETYGNIDLHAEKVNLKAASVVTTRDDEEYRILDEQDLDGVQKTGRATVVVVSGDEELDGSADVYIIAGGSAEEPWTIELPSDPEAGTRFQAFIGNNNVYIRPAGTVKFYTGMKAKITSTNDLFLLSDLVTTWNGNVCDFLFDGTTWHLSFNVDIM